MQRIVSELVTNALHHGVRPPVSIAVFVGRASGLRVNSRSATDQQLPPVHDWKSTGSSRPGGRGLAIVRALGEHVSVVRIGEDLSVSVRMRAHS